MDAVGLQRAGGALLNVGEDLAAGGIKGAFPVLHKKGAEVAGAIGARLGTAKDVANAAGSGFVEGATQGGLTGGLTKAAQGAKGALFPKPIELTPSMVKPPPAEPSPDPMWLQQMLAQAKAPAPPPMPAAPTLRPASPPPAPPPAGPNPWPTLGQKPAVPVAGPADSLPPPVLQPAAPAAAPPPGPAKPPPGVTFSDPTIDPHAAADAPVWNAVDDMARRAFTQALQRMPAVPPPAPAAAPMGDDALKAAVKAGVEKGVPIKELARQLGVNQGDINAFFQAAQLGFL